MAAGGDIVELVHEQTYLGQQCNNVYYFEAVVGGALLSALATWFETNVVPDVKAHQLEDVSHINLRLRNLFNSAETYEEPLTGTGAILNVDVELPSFFASQIRLDHDSGDVRPGFKRFVGIGEEHIADALFRPGQIAALLDIGANLVNPPLDANPDWAHVVVGRVCDELNPVEGAVPRCLKYVLPRTQAEAALAGIGYPTTVEAYPQPTTQNSRKYYT